VHAAGDDAGLADERHQCLYVRADRAGTVRADRRCLQHGPTLRRVFFQGIVHPPQSWTEISPVRQSSIVRRRRLAEYLLRAPFSLDKITCNADTSIVLYRSERHWRTKRNFEVFSASAFIAALVAQSPLEGAPQARYYGWYGNKGLGRK